MITPQYATTEAQVGSSSKYRSCTESALWEDNFPISYYSSDRTSRAVDPDALPDSATSVTVDTAPIQRRDMNDMEEGGRIKFVAIVEEVKPVVRGLWYVV